VSVLNHCHVSAQIAEHADREGQIDERQGYVDMLTNELLTTGQCCHDDTVIDTDDIIDALQEHEGFEAAVLDAGANNGDQMHSLVKSTAHDLVDKEVPYVE